MVWWRHQMETFSALLTLCAGNSPVTKASATDFDVFFDLRLNNTLSKQSWDRCFDTPPRSLWCHCNEFLWWLGLLKRISTQRYELGLLNRFPSFHHFSLYSEWLKHISLLHTTFVSDRWYYSLAAVTPVKWLYCNSAKSRLSLKENSRTERR